jgi:hypothetical protein
MNVNNYECPNCHNVFPESNKFLHEQRCTSSKPVPLNQSRVAFIKSQEEKNKKKEPVKHISQPNYQTNKNILLKEQNQTQEEDNEFTCWLCGNTLKEKEKADHMLCHQMQVENDEFKKNNKKLVDNENKKDNDRPRRDLPRKEQTNNRIQNLPNQRNQGQININENNQRRNLKRSQLKFSDWQIFDFGGLKSSLNNLENPTDVDILEQLPESEIEDTSQLTKDTNECYICFTNFSKLDKITIFPCTHMFHSLCVEAWLKEKDFCPVCKNKIVKGTY